MKTTFTLIAVLAATVSSIAQITWDPIIDVAGSGYGNNFPRIVLDGSGNPVVSWGDGGENMNVATWDGSSFNTPVQVNPGGVTIAEANWQGPDIEANGNNIFAIYKETPESNPDSEVWCVKSTDGGATWGTPVQVDASIGATGVSRFPTLTSDDAGNPIAAYMKFDPGFTGARYVVSKSTDGGATFGVDTIASGLGGAGSEVCDCCPATVESSGSNVVMSYRDNDSDIRDTWIGVSTNSGVSFTDGFNMDQLGWNIAFCPSSGPDAVIVGDTLYVTFMSGQSGSSLVYWNKTSLSSPAGSAGMPMTGSIAGLSSQNYPRIDANGNAMAMVWDQIVSGSDEIAIYLTSDITSGWPSSYELVATDNVTSTDVAIGDGEVHVVWRNPISGTVKYRKGTFTTGGGGATVAEDEMEMMEAFPNPTNDTWTISGLNDGVNVELYGSDGRLINSTLVQNGQVLIDARALTPGVYTVRTTGSEIQSIQLVKE